MRSVLPGCAAIPLPSAAKTQRTISRVAFTAISTGSTVQREGLTVARVASHLPLDAVERTTGADATGAHDRLDARFDGVEAVSDRAEDRFLSAMLSTSQRTHEYAELLDESVESFCPATGEVAN